MANKLDGYRVPKNSVATCSSDGTIRFWSLVDLAKSTDSQVLIVDPEEYAASKKTTKDSVSNVELRCIKMSPGGGLIASGDREGNIRVHSLTDFKQIFSLEAHDSDVLSIDFSARFDEASKSALPWMMASAGRDRFVHVFDVKGGFTHTQTLDDHSAAVISANFSRDNSFLMTSSADRAIRFKEYKKVIKKEKEKKKKMTTTKHNSTPFYVD
jgi:WD40 repeat protein